MSIWDWFIAFFYGPAFGLLLATLASYVVVYVLAFLTTRAWISLRRGKQPTIDQIAHRTLLGCFLLCTALPIFFIFQLVTQYPSHVIPFAVAILVNVMILAKLFGKSREPKLRRKKHA